MSRRGNFVLGFLGVAVVFAMVAVLGFGIINRVWVYDYFRGSSYEPVGEMGQIRDKLKLTERGDFLFRASRPVLMGKESFNSTCRSAVDAEVAVLGCYTGGNIYVYNIDAAELKGIRELTTAHELLHAVWARMSEEERSKLNQSLTQTFNENQELLERELKTYDAAERQEELYVRAGTEVANLPADLERHYAEIFADQDLIVEFYKSYITVFREIEAEMDELKAKMDVLKTEIDVKTEEYYNMVGTQEEFNALYEEINVMIAEYNNMVTEYNADIVRHDQLNQMIDSNDKVDEIK